jgi:hypothetical protein
MAVIPIVRNNLSAAWPCSSPPDLFRGPSTTFLLAQNDVDGSPSRMFPTWANHELPKSGIPDFGNKSGHDAGLLYLKTNSTAVCLKRFPVNLKHSPHA